MRQASGPQLDTVSATEGAGEMVTATLTFSHAQNLHLNGTAACALATDASKRKGVTGPCCKLSPFHFRTVDGEWVRTETPVAVSGSKVVVTAKVSGGLSAVSDVAYAFEALPPCALYAGAAASGPDSHDGLVATPFRRALSSPCPAKTKLCPGVHDHHPGAAGDQCCSDQTSSHKEACVSGMGCYGGKGSVAPSYGPDDPAAAPPSTTPAKLDDNLAPGRTTVPFQYAWRFHYGDDPSSPPGSGPGTAVFETDLANYSVCEGMEHAPNRFSLKDCRLACSYDPNCLVWQAFPIEHGRMCYQAYTGMNVTCHPPDGEAPSFMDGGQRAAPPDPAFRTDYPFALADATSTVDADWAVVDAPHDFIAEYGNFTEDSSDLHHGYLPRNVSW